MFHLSKHHEIGYAMPVYRLEGHKEGSGLENDVRLFNITIYRNVPKLVSPSKSAEKKNSTPGPGF